MSHRSPVPGRSATRVSRIGDPRTPLLAPRQHLATPAGAFTINVKVSLVCVHWIRLGGPRSPVAQCLYADAAPPGQDYQPMHKLGARPASLPVLGSRIVDELAELKFVAQSIVVGSAHWPAPGALVELLGPLVRASAPAI